ncbi:LLM class flavin-dependent oxidoreductase [Mycolicibacterium goodii]|uniref:LLM class flavin-dependent oxidoreductase n=1 Tax=Mycolicibacterium goodii TaxID=134601 RepID=UPI001BDC198E|nr:LLM class flavin-dependent oxidoreductase [Mycolicibacterium goodii]MBU8816708.1 LLM class flavin-dependent oxidoreductase [Mycolicibacterium goodii]
MSPRDRRLIFNAFTNASANHLSPGMWRHPCDRAGTEFMTFDYWRDLARVAEDAKFDAIFLADSFGIPDNYRGSFHPALRHAAQAPKIDPFPVLAGMVGVTSKLGLVVTGSTTYEHPFSFARRLSTIDHLSDGRLGWNVVTSALDSSARAFGLRAQFDHDERYERAEEFLEVVFGLWERSWQIESLTPDRGDDVYLDPNAVIDIDHQGAFYTVKGPHVSPPSPQRTPVLYQAGGSSRGLRFAAERAEVAFIGAWTEEGARRDVAQIRSCALAAGRDPDSIKTVLPVTVVTAATDEEALEKRRNYLHYVDREGALTLFSAWTGVDWSRYGQGADLEYLSTGAQRGILEALTGHHGDRRWTVGEVADAIALGGLRPVIVGGPATCADELERLADDLDIDGFNLTAVVSPGTFEDFAAHVVPELQRRGRYWLDYPDGTLRERMFGTPDRHSL